jgi:hypothetical protein
MVTVCERCRDATQIGGGKAFAIAPAALEMSECDASYLDAETQRAIPDIPPRMRRFVRHRDGGRCCVPGCRASRHIHLHHIVSRSRAGGHQAHSTQPHRALMWPLRALARWRARNHRRAPNLVIRWARLEARGREAERVLIRANLAPELVRRAVRESCAHVGNDARVETLIEEALKRVRSLRKVSS